MPLTRPFGKTELLRGLAHYSAEMNYYLTWDSVLSILQDPLHVGSAPLTWQNMLCNDLSISVTAEIRDVDFLKIVTEFRWGQWLDWGAGQNSENHTYPKSFTFLLVIPTAQLGEMDPLVQAGFELVSSG